MLLLDAAAAMESAPGLARLMASLLNQDEEWIEDQVSAFTEMASGYLVKTGI
jgi:glycerol-3-phosphate dehydrogenase